MKHRFEGFGRKFLLLALFALSSRGAWGQAVDLVGGPEPLVPAGPPGPTWRAPLVLLFDNGPLITHPTGGFGGAPASRLQNVSLGMAILGFSASLPLGFRVADDFTVPSPGWFVNTITFFAYQTGSGTSSTLNDVRVQIWNGPPNVGTSSVVFGDLTTNRLGSTSFSGIYRDAETLVGNNQRPLMVAVANIGTHLAPGTYWVDFQIGGTLGSGPFVAPVTILGSGQKPGSNSLQFLSPSWSAVVDAGNGQAQDVPFLIDGEACNPMVPTGGITVGTQAPACSAVVSYSASLPTGCSGTVTCTPPSGSTFPLGVTAVSCTSPNGGAASFNVTVVDDDPPGIVCPGPQSVTTGNPSGAPVSYPPATASDNCTSSPTVSCTPASGSTFPLGTTNVSCTATDGASNPGSCTFPVTVSLLQPPMTIPTLSVTGLLLLAGGIAAGAWFLLRKRIG